MFSNEAVYMTEVKFGPNLGLEKLEADVLHDQVDMDAESYDIYGKSEIVEYNQRGVKYKQKFGVKECIHGVDILIAETIAILNRKGYITSACCQGHLPYQNNLIYQVDTSSSSKLEELFDSVKNGQREVVQIKDNAYFAVTGAIYCWIRFDERTAFPSLPEKFNLEKIKMSGTNPWVLSVTVPSYYFDNGELKKKSVENLAQELIEMHESLKTWTYTLPPLSINPEDDYLNKPQRQF